MATRFRQAPVPYRPGYRGPIYGQAPQMFGRMLANRTGIGSIPFAGPRMQNLMTRGFTRLGQFGQRLPGGRRIGNFLNRIARPINRMTDMQDNLANMTNPMAMAGQFAGGQGRGRGGLLGFGLMGRRRGQGAGRGGILGLGLFRGGQGRGATGFSQMTPMERFSRQQYLETAGPISSGMDMDSYGFGQSIQRPDATSIAAGVNREVIESLPFQQVENIMGDDGNRYYQLVDKATGNVFLQGQQHPDYKPSGPRMQRIGGGM